MAKILCYKKQRKSWNLISRGLILRGLSRHCVCPDASILLGSKRPSILDIEAACPEHRRKVEGYECSNGSAYSPRAPRYLISLLRGTSFFLIISLSVMSLVGGNNNSDSDIQAMLADPQVQAFLDQPERSSTFYEDYIKRYYPKINAFCYQTFLTFTPEQVEAAIKDIVNVFVVEPHLYFACDSKDFKIRRYWEYVIDQLSLLHNFIGKAYVNLEEKHIFIPSAIEKEAMLNFSFGGFSRGVSPQKNQTMSLAKYLHTHSTTVIYDFYALSFDYLIKMFNEGILLQDKKQIERYFAELEYVCERLRGSSYEQEYTENVKIARDLMGILKNKMRVEFESKRTARGNER